MNLLLPLAPVHRIFALHQPTAFDWPTPPTPTAASVTRPLDRPILLDHIHNTKQTFISAMSSTNFWSILDTEAPKTRNETPTSANTTTRTSYASNKMMRKMALTAEVSFETTAIGTSTTSEDEATGTKPKSFQAGESTLAEASEDAKKAKKAAKKLRQKIKASRIAPDAVSQGIKDGISGAQGADAAVASGSAGDTDLAVTSEVAVNQPGQVQSSSEDEDGDLFVDAPSVSDLVDIDELAELYKTATATDDIVQAPTEAAVSTAVQCIQSTQPANTVAARKNALANKRKKENKKKAREAKMAAELREQPRMERMEAGAMGLGAVSFVCLLLWAICVSFSRR